MFDSEEEKDFVHECNIMENMYILLFFDKSDRVQVAVLIEMLKKIISNQENPERSLEQVINALRMKEDV